MFCNILVCDSLQYAYYVTETVQAAVDCIVVVGALTHCALFHLCVIGNLQKMNVQHSLIQELMPHGFKVSHNTTEATVNIYCAKSDGIVNQIMVQESLLHLQEP